MDLRYYDSFAYTFYHGVNSCDNCVATNKIAGRYLIAVPSQRNTVIFFACILNRHCYTARNYSYLLWHGRYRISFCNVNTVGVFYANAFNSCRHTGAKLCNDSFVGDSRISFAILFCVEVTRNHAVTVCKIKQNRKLIAVYRTVFSDIRLDLTRHYFKAELLAIRHT